MGKSFLQPGHTADWNWGLQSIPAFEMHRKIDRIIITKVVYHLRRRVYKLQILVFSKLCVLFFP